MAQRMMTADGFPLWGKAAGLETFDQYLHSPVGELLDSGRNGRELRRITFALGDRTRIFYFKRLGREPSIKLVQMLLFGYRPDPDRCGRNFC